MKFEQVKCLRFVLPLALFLLMVSPVFGADCAKVNLGVSPTTAGSGQTVTITGSVTSCATAPEMVTVQIHLAGPAGISDSGSVAVNLTPSDTITVNVPVTIPTLTPPGNYTLTATATSGGTQLGTAAATLKVI